MIRLSKWESIRSKPEAKERINERIQQGNYLFLFSTWYLSQFFPPMVWGTAGEKILLWPQGFLILPVNLVHAWLKKRTAQLLFGDQNSKSCSKFVRAEKRVAIASCWAPLCFTAGQGSSGRTVSTSVVHCYWFPWANNIFCYRLIPRHHH